MHMRWLVRCLTSVLIVSLITCTAVAAEYSARAYSMGGAYNALSSDVTGLAYNPGGLGQKWFDAAWTMGSTDSETLSKLRSALKNPTDLGQDYDMSGLAAIGLGPVALGLLIDGKYEVDTEGVNKIIDTEFQQRMAIGAGFTVVSVPLNAGKLRMGFQVQRRDAERRRFKVNTDTSAVTETAWNGVGYSLGVGVLANITELVTLGVSARDLAAQTHWTGTATSGGVTTAEPSYTERLTSVTSGSVAVRLPFPKITLAIDGDTVGTVHFGAEANFLFNAISLRAGQTRPKDGTPITTAGLGVNLGPISVGVGAGTKNGFTALDTSFADVSIRF
jgi:opacity protein-like surface antigen